MRKPQWEDAPGLLLALALVFQACTVEEAPPNGPDGGATVADTRLSADSALAADASADDGVPPDLDGKAGETSISGKDADASPLDGVIDATAEGAPTDANLGDATGENSSASDAADGALDTSDVAEAAIADAPDASSDVNDGAFGDGSTVPIYAVCSYAQSIQAIPAAIIDATVAEGDHGSCSCSFSSKISIHRVLCGSLPPGATISLPAICNPDDPKMGDRLMMVVYPDPIKCFGLVETAARPFPASAWDAMLEEQRWGVHPDGGGLDVGLDIDAAGD